MKLIPCIAAAAALFSSTQGHASYVTVSTGAYSSEAGAVTATFDAGAQLTLTRSGGAVYAASVNQVAAAPSGSTGNFWSIGTSGNQAGPGVIDLLANGGTGAVYYGFLWGSPDSFNTVSFYDGNTLLQSYTGSSAFGSANGNQSVAKFFNFYAAGSEVITKVVFTSTGNAFETDNHALISANVPEPGSSALVLVGLAAMGALARRRAPRA